MAQFFFRSDGVPSRTGQLQLHGARHALGNHGYHGDITSKCALNCNKRELSIKTNGVGGDHDDHHQKDRVQEYCVPARAFALIRSLISSRSRVNAL
jgi:hypothetical protein